MKNDSNPAVPHINIRKEIQLFQRFLFVIFLLFIVMVIVIGFGHMDDEVEGTGTVEGIREYELKTLVDAKTTAIFKHPGDFVRAGEKLLELDSRDQRNRIVLLEHEIKELEIAIQVKKKELDILRKDPLPGYYRHTELELKEAAERYQRSQMELESYKELYEKKAISKHEFLQIEMEHISKKINLERLQEDSRKLGKGSMARDILEKAQDELRQMQQQLDGKKAELEMENIRLSNYVLTAPDTGIVTDIPPRPGNYYTQGTILIRLAANQNKKVVVLVRESQIFKVKPGQHARIRCSLYNYLDYGYFYGRVEYVYQLPEIINGEKFYPVKLILLGEPYPLRFGSSCTATIITGRERILFALLGIQSRNFLERKVEGMIQKRTFRKNARNAENGEEPSASESRSGQ